jgi:hypothetical protein
MFFQDIVVGALLDALDSRLFAQSSSDQKKRDILSKIPEFANRLNPSPVRQVIVCEYHVEIARLHSGLKLLFPSHQRVNHVETGVLEMQQQQFKIVRRIFQDKGTQTRAAPGCLQLLDGYSLHRAPSVGTPTGANRRWDSTASRS